MMKRMIADADQLQSSPLVGFIGKTGGCQSMYTFVKKDDKLEVNLLRGFEPTELMKQWSDMLVL